MTEQPTSTAPNPPPPGEIEVGATAREMRFYLAKEAVRQGEATLASQAAIRATLESRATALTGWAAASLLAVAGATFATTRNDWTLAGIIAGFALFASAAIGIHTARPRDWALVGYDPTTILENRRESELEFCESLAAGISAGILANNDRLRNMGSSVRWTGRLLIAAPVIGLAAHAALVIRVVGAAAWARLLSL